MTTHYDDEAQAEQLKAWWKENWMALAAGLAIGLAGIFGWQGWQKHSATRAGEASQMYEELKKLYAENQTDRAPALVDKLVADYAKTPYAANAQLRAAGEAVKAGDYAAALPRLQWVREHSDDAGLKAVAQLRIARLQWQQNEIDAALKTLDGGDAAFAPLFDELRGDIQLAKGDVAAARSAYEKAFAATPAEQPGRQLLQRKLDDLAVQS